ncbi:MAG: HAD-IIA family hydrolase [Promethearchaeota archaeon]|nr:MAG: HAD-IIA family hydrolase [Candidatus Lokiarchaeota archaeon]
MSIKQSFQNIKGLLIDIDGTLYFKEKPIPKSIETVSKLRETGLKLLFLTNTDSKTPITILKILEDYGFQVWKDEIFTPIIALKEFLSKYTDKKFYFVTTAEVSKEFQEFRHVEGSEIPDFVIISDFHDNWDVNRLNLAFKFVLKGAKLLGTQGNKYYLDRYGEPVIDTGSFIQMIATAANVVPRIFGKPSKEYFLQALERLILKPDDVCVIGDDLESDIQGGINAGIKGILVKTGKGQFYDPSKSDIEPYLVLDSFSSIIELIKL